MSLYRLNLTGAEAGRFIAGSFEGEKVFFGAKNKFSITVKMGDFELKNVVFDGFRQKGQTI